jgi:LytS/YehU family sensor histidine kinase
MANLELSALKAQMNPHFVFNALGAIQYFIQTNEVDAADDYLTRFALLMRKYLDSSKEKMISLKEEIELLTIYTDLEQLRFEDLFDVTIRVDEDISTEDRFIPSMLIQPFIENAVNHGLNERRDGKGQLDILFSQKEEMLICEIKDNGIGHKAAKKRKRKTHKSRGMSIIKDKIETLKTIGLADISISIKELNPEDADFPGTHVIIKIKDLEDEKI